MFHSFYLQPEQNPDEEEEEKSPSPAPVQAQQGKGGKKPTKKKERGK